jgi:hypothetical protein
MITYAAGTPARGAFETRETFRPGIKSDRKIEVYLSKKEKTAIIYRRQ